MKNFVIYTAIVGNYDKISQPEKIDNEFDYILFSNEISEKKIGVWVVKPIPYTNSEPTRIARYVKVHPEILLSDYVCSVWIDANITITSDFIYSRTKELYRQGELISTMDHFWRQCVYEEAFFLLHSMYEKENVVLRWGNKLRKEKYPKKNGLYETGVMFRVHSNEKINNLDILWWNCIEKFSKRDQLSFNYALWKLGLKCTFFISDGMNVRNTKHFRLISHNNSKSNIILLKKNEAWLMRYCWKRKDKIEKIKNIYFHIYKFPLPILSAFLTGQYYRFVYILEHFFKKINNDLENN